ncbi:RecX family transcriptional regulator [Photobacterium sp. SDRW27]|uniref:RecX family transcriptional regulator n=1 Tax=Photobacterium obscurum TaxID=2829490 RepID=UPI0022441EEF|nr:RecX family transcriptional regulator [Photobacterium obscurum]MCW8329876.1 RecX family transcriptional regulator [Photobacterium obscurum]
MPSEKATGKRAGPKPATKIEDVYEYAIWWLNQRGYSEMKLKDKLTRKTDNTEWISLVINRLLEQGYLSDRRYAETFVQSRCQSYGPKLLAQKLSLQGVAQADIEQALSLINDSDTDVLISRVIAKYSGKKSIRDISMRLRGEGVDESRIRLVMSHSVDTEHESQLAVRLINKHAKKMGRSGLLQKLRSEGISQDTIEHVLSDEKEEDVIEDDQQKALALLNRKYKHSLADFAEKKKATAFLVRKGFSFAEANYAIEHHLE